MLRTTKQPLKIAESSLIYFEMDVRRTTEEGGSYLVVMTD